MSFKSSVMGGTLILIVFACWINAKSCEAFGTFGFDVHHRYSDTVKNFLAVDELPEEGTIDYYAAMAHRDKFLKSRRLAASSSSDNTILTLLGGNQTFKISSLGFLHYAIVSVGTPPLTFLVALDTGSDLFWLPCECTNCARRLNLSSGQILDLNIYSVSASTTSSPVPCNSTMCGPTRGCTIRQNACAYQEVYLSSNTSSTGILVDDVLHLETDAPTQDLVNVPITMGCGLIQTGDFLDGAAVNGLFGLGMGNVSVPSILANKGLVANSFSMCFGPDGLGRIEFGDTGSADQNETPFNVQQSNPTYNVTVTQIAVEKNITVLEFTAIFDSGTSFTYLNDPAYSVIAKGFNAQIVNEPRYQPTTELIFDYCYALNATQDSYLTPDLNFTLRGGDQLLIKAPTIVIPREGGYAYCLALVKSEDINIIGQNFMTGYRIFFDREKNVLGWKDSDCYDSTSSTDTPSTPPPASSPNSPAAPPPSVLEPEAAPTNRSRSPVTSPAPRQSQPGNNHGTSLNSMANRLLMAALSVFSILFIILSS